MMLKVFGYILFLLSVSCFACDSGNPVATASPIPSKSNQQNLSQGQEGRDPSVDVADGFKKSNVKAPYLGCWSGMHGGMLKITPNLIYDLGSQEESPYELVQVAKVEDPDIDGGETYVMQSPGSPFAKSFLSKILEISFSRSNTVGFTAYESFEDYKSGKIEGQALLGELPCSELHPERNRYP